MGVTFDTLGGNCPVQAEGKFLDMNFYFRARGTRWSLEIGETISHGMNYEWLYFQEYGDNEYAAGWMEEYEALEFIIFGISKWLHEHGLKQFR
jgi:hypothetical protein